MAEAAWGNKICPHFLNDNCWFGDNCRFIHPCRYYLQGRCKFGDSCWNSHDDHIQEYASRQLSPNRLINYSGRTRTENPSTTSLIGENTLTNRNSPKKAVQSNVRNGRMNDRAQEFLNRSKKPNAKITKLPEICLDFANGRCLLNDRCPLVHGELCDFCRKACLNPLDPKQREEHMELCCKNLDQVIAAKELSDDKMCGICMDIVMEKEPLSERRFGILENCNHVFCFTCIMKWRNIKTHRRGHGSEVDPSALHCCPECRVTSPFVVPSEYWFTTEEEKKKKVKQRKDELGRRPCPQFQQGKGHCPYGGSCYFLHALPDGTKVDLPLPRQRAAEASSFLTLVELLTYSRLRESVDELVEQFVSLSSESEFDYDYDDEDFEEDTFFF